MMTATVHRFHAHPLHQARKLARAVAASMASQPVTTLDTAWEILSEGDADDRLKAQAVMAELEWRANATAKTMRAQPGDDPLTLLQAPTYEQSVTTLKIAACIGGVAVLAMVGAVKAGVL